MYNLSKSSPKDNNENKSKVQPTNKQGSCVKKPQDTNNSNHQTPLTNNQQQNKTASIKNEQSTKEKINKLIGKRKLQFPDYSYPQS